MDGNGEVVEWLVKMHRLSSTKMLGHLIHTGSTSLEIMRRIAALLADFHAACPRAVLAKDACRDRLSREVHLNFSELSKPQYKLPTGFLARICAAQDRHWKITLATLPRVLRADILSKDMAICRRTCVCR